MKRFMFALGAAALLLSSCGEPRSRAERLMGNYALVTIAAPDLSGISDNGKEVLNLYRFAADEADRIYWEQNFGDKDAFLASLPEPAQKDYALINYGPWDRLDGKAFVGGYSDKPAGARFYPEDMTPQEWEAFDDPAKNSPYTLIRRNADGALETVWYHDAYAPHIEKICSYLNAAADITIKESVRNYLLKKIDGLRSDDYYESERAWLEMTDSKMDLVLGPNEAVDDALYGRKASFGAYVLLKNLERTEQLNALSEHLEEFQQLLPGNPAYHSFTPGAESDIFSCNVIYYGGYTNAGFKVIAINFPYDTRVQEELGTRTILFDNIIREKFNRTVFPVGMTLLESEHQAHLDASAFYWTIVFRELAKGLGVKETVNGRGSVAEALGNEALVIEKAKSNVLGAWLCASQVNAHHIQALIQRDDVLATFVTNIIRSCRFGAADPTGQANLLVYNWLASQGAITRKASGRYGIDYDGTAAALESLGARILEIQATGDREAALALVGEYAVSTPAIQADKVSLELEKIPVDIRFTYEK